MKQTFTDLLASQVISDLRSGVALRNTLGHTIRGKMQGYLYVNDKGATIRIQSFTKEGGKNSKFVIAITPKEGRTTEISGPQASLAWRTIVNPTKLTRSTGIVDRKAVADAMAALGMEV